MKLEFSPTALKDLHRLYTFIENENPPILPRAADKILRSFEIIKKFPQAGYVLEQLPPFRELLVPFGRGNYVIRYRVEKGVVYIVHLWHSREDRD